jgi:hypothetical protein
VGAAQCWGSSVSDVQNFPVRTCTACDGAHLAHSCWCAARELLACSAGAGACALACPGPYLQLLLALACLAAEVSLQVPVAPPRTHGHLLALAEGKLMRGVNEVKLLQAYADRLGDGSFTGACYAQLPEHIGRCMMDRLDMFPAWCCA